MEVPSLSRNIIIILVFGYFVALGEGIPPEDFDIWNDESDGTHSLQKQRFKKDSPSDSDSDEHDHDHHHVKADCGFTCDNGKCISAHKVCDNYVHCADTSDEIHCTCKDRVGLKKLCDGISDCPNNEDENGCECSELEFSCDDAKSEMKQGCVPLSKRCNGVKDCTTGKDELNCFRLHTFDFIRGVLSEGILQKMIGNEWYTICKGTKTSDRLMPFYAAKTCHSISGDTDDEIPSVTVQSWDSEHNEQNEQRFALMGESEAKFSIRSSICSSSKVYKVTCPQPTCGWPASKYDRSAHSGRHHKRSVDFDSEVDINELTAKIVGGVDSNDGDWPFIIGIFKNGSFHCGGMIIHPQWVLTAAHCFHGFEKYAFEVQAGMLRRFSWSPHEQTRQVVRVYVHERYDSKIFLNDITLLKLDVPFYMSKYVTTACLAPPDKSLDPRQGQMCSVIGWGNLAETSRGPDRMQQVDLPVLAKCQETFTNDLIQVCAGFVAGGKDACQGDSGGPFVCHDDGGRPILNGLVSFGRGCARPRQAGVYTKVSSYIDWIDSVVSGENKIIKSPKHPRTCGTPDGKCLRAGGECLFSKMICDRKVDCLDASDETNCEYPDEFEENFGVDERAYTEVEHATHGDVEHVHNIGNSKLCGPTEFQCQHTKSCVPEKLKCNGVSDCSDETDEKGCDCVDIIRNVYPSKICDNVWDCLDGSDEQDCGPCQGRKNSVKCPFSDTCILARRWCDGMKHCEDGEDETDCMRLIRSKDSIISEGFLSDKLSRGLQSGYAVLRTSGTTWSKVCSEDMGDTLDDIFCHYLGYNLKGDSSTWSRNTRTARIFTQRELPVSSFKGRTGQDLEDADEHTPPAKNCTPVKVACGEAFCGERRLYSYSQRDPGAHEVGAQPWFVLVSVEGSPVCPATLVHKNWAIASTQCILSHIRSFTHEYVTVISGFTQKSPIIASPLEQIKRVNGIEKLSSGFSLLHLDSPVMSDHFAAPICTGLRDGVTFDSVFRAQCSLILYNHENYAIADQRIQLDSLHSVEGTEFAIRLNNTQCEESDDAFVYCTSDGSRYYYLGNTGDVNLTSCKKEGYAQLINPFYGLRQEETEEILTSPPFTTHKPPVCNGVRCSFGNCVEKTKVCDGVYHCNDFQDEKRCQRHFQGVLRSNDDEEFDNEEGKHSSANSCALHTEPAACPVGHFRCKTTGNCVPISVFCDMVNDCGPDDFSDEPIDPEQCSCRHYLEMAAPERICDSHIHCPNRGDELGCPCHANSFYCNGFNDQTTLLLETECINATFVCDGVKDCKNAKDEYDCIAVSINLQEIEPSEDKGSIHGYVLVRVKGVWHPYCSSEWSKSMGQEICSHLGYGKLDSLELFSLSDFIYNQQSSTENVERKAKLMVALKVDAEADSFQIYDLSDSDGNDVYWTTCEVGRIRCGHPAK